VNILLDHCVDWRLARAFPAHSVKTARDMGWETLQNGKLLSAAAEASFDLLLTVDRKLKHEQNLTKLPIAVLVLIAPTNKLSDLLPVAPAVETALKSLQPKTLIEVAQAQAT